MPYTDGNDRVCLSEVTGNERSNDNTCGLVHHRRTGQRVVLQMSLARACIYTVDDMCDFDDMMF